MTSTRIICDRKNREVTIKYDKRYYGLGAILQAGKDFTSSCWVYVDEDKDGKFEVTIKPKKEGIDMETLGYEFSNYALGLMQNAMF